MILSKSFYCSRILQIKISLWKILKKFLLINYDPRYISQIRKELLDNLSNFLLATSKHVANGLATLIPKFHFSQLALCLIPSTHCFVQSLLPWLLELFSFSTTCWHLGTLFRQTYILHPLDVPNHISFLIDPCCYWSAYPQ